MGIQSGTSGDMTIARSIPVITALPSDTVIFLCMNFCIIASVATAVATLISTSSRTRGPKKYVPAMTAGIRLITTVHIILEIESLSRMCGDVDTISRLSSM